MWNPPRAELLFTNVISISPGLIGAAGGSNWQSKSVSDTVPPSVGAASVADGLGAGDGVGGAGLAVAATVPG